MEAVTSWLQAHCKVPLTATKIRSEQRNTLDRLITSPPQTEQQNDGSLLYSGRQYNVKKKMRARKRFLMWMHYTVLLGACSAVYVLYRKTSNAEFLADLNGCKPLQSHRLSYTKPATMTSSEPTDDVARKSHAALWASIQRWRKVHDSLLEPYSTL
jgi:hypothetical protein